MDIDLVYTWVDSSDIEWQKKKNKYLYFNEDYDSDATDSCRFCNNDELKYSLRSVEKYANWINKIYIITDNQIPNWLNTNHSRIKIVEHKEIIPEEKLPTFNSCAIESRIPYIENLSEYFLYANDDMLFWNTVDKEFFYKDEKPICRMDKFFIRNRKYKHLYGNTVQRAYNLVRSKYKTNFCGFFPHHNVDAYRKSLFLECINEFKEEFEQTLSNRFRDFSDIQRTIVEFYSIAQKKAILKKSLPSFFQIMTNQESDAVLFELNKISTKILKSKSKLICFNDSRKTSDRKRNSLRYILEQKFPIKSCFEL